MKGILGTTAIIIAALTAAPASAGSLFKCQGDDGITSYVSKRVPGARCRSISYSRDTRRPAKPRAVPAEAPVQNASTTPAATQAVIAERN